MSVWTTSSLSPQGWKLQADREDHTLVNSQPLAVHELQSRGIGMSVEVKDDRLWSIILAGGEGERLRPFIQKWLGRHTPKQYCAFVGRRSMLQHTIDRADRIAKPDQKTTVIARSHEPDARRQFDQRQCGIIIKQPANRDT